MDLPVAGTGSLCRTAPSPSRYDTCLPLQSQQVEMMNEITCLMLDGKTFILLYTEWILCNNILI